jgi:endonuclease/exonuclease/phosphatase family metal-dependent hydrolase
MTWNVQYMAGKDYVFWYDVPDMSGPDERPASEAISRTLGDVARMIRSTRPDVVLLQEVDDGADRTDREDQLARLLALLPDEYTCHVSAFYWKARFVPHPRIMGSVGMKLSTIARYRIAAATRHQLPVVRDDLLTRQFTPKRAVLEVRLPIAGGAQFAALNTHLEAWAGESDIMEQQVAAVQALLEQLAAERVSWVLGGDFNLLPPGQYQKLAGDQRVYYAQSTQLAVLYDRYQAVPSLADVTGPAAAAWVTHFPNDPAVSAPDRTIDYVFVSNDVTVTSTRVGGEEMLAVSDHLPVIATILVP